MDNSFNSWLSAFCVPKTEHPYTIRELRQDEEGYGKYAVENKDGRIVAYCGDQSYEAAKKIYSIQ